MRKTTKIDLHLHTLGSDGSGTPVQIACAAKASGLDGLCITDHHRTRTPEGDAVARACRDLGLLVFHGCEYSTAQGHLLIYGIDVALLRLGCYPDIQKTIDAVVAAGGVAIPSHPYKGYKRRLEDNVMRLKRVRAYEVENGQLAEQNPRINKLAWCAAKLKDRMMTGGSDAHRPDDIGITYTCFEGPIQTEAQFIRALKRGVYRPVVAQKRLEERATSRRRALRTKMDRDILVWRQGRGYEVL